ncbi:polysaccharide lyase, partial [Vibrio cholerae]|uniref:polysaccharide lyase n=1 Tax=Vibrio cholerae TaxID=666 RepID=UPI001F2439D4
QIIPNRNYRFDFKRKWRSDYTGKIEVYIDKVLVLTIDGANTIRPYNPSVPKQPVDRYGIYWFAAKSAPESPDINTKVAVFDNVSVGR